MLLNAHYKPQIKKNTILILLNAKLAKVAGCLVKCDTFRRSVVELKKCFEACLCFLSSTGESLPLSTGNQITIKFTTVGPETAKGFHFVYQGQFNFNSVLLFAYGSKRSELILFPLTPYASL